MTGRVKGPTEEVSATGAEAMIDALLQTVPDPLWIVGPGGAITHGNAAFLRLCEKALHRPITLPVAAETLLDGPRLASAQTWWDNLAGRALAGRSVMTDARVVLDGTEHAFSIAINPAPGGAVCIARDITDVRPGERENLFELAVNRLFDMKKPLGDTLSEILAFLCETDEWDCAVVWLLDGDQLAAGTVWTRDGLDTVRFRERIRELRFTHGHGIPGRAWAAGDVVWLPDLLDESNASRAESAARAGLHGTAAMPLRDGARVVGVLELLTRAIRPMNEQRKRALLRASDSIGRLIERRRLLELIERKGREWATTFDAIELPIFITTMDGAITRLNRAARELTGAASYPDVLARGLISFGQSEPWTTLAQLVEAVRDSHTPCTAQAIDAEDHSWDLNGTVFRSADDGGERAIIVMRDTTAMVRLQESVRRGEQLAALGELVAGVAHEVRNPIFGMGLTLDAIEASIGGDAELHELSGVLRQWLDRLNRLMESLLEYGKTWTLELRAGTIDRAIRHALTGCRPLAAQSGVEVVVDLEPDLTLLMDVNRLSHAFENLIANAAQHSSAGQRVFVTASAEGPSTIVCTVHDEGPGFAVADLRKIFQPFFTRRRGGTGLGLSIVQRVVDEHGGTIAAGNLADRGAVVTLRFPAYRPGASG
jgi:signal transduction histidine kinase